MKKFRVLLINETGGHLSLSLDGELRQLDVGEAKEFQVTFAERFAKYEVVRFEKIEGKIVEDKKLRSEEELEEIKMLMGVKRSPSEDLEYTAIFGRR